MTVSRRRVARFERIALPYVRARQEASDGIYEIIRRGAFQLMANICLLTLHGEPRIDEPLLQSWDRVRKSAAWTACREQHPDFAEYGYEDEGDFAENRPEEANAVGSRKHFGVDSRYIATPFDDLGAGYIAQYFRKYFLPELAGATESEKLNAILARTPPWLIWFTNADLAALKLRLTAPNISKERRFVRDKPDGDFLPEGPFERKLRPKRVDDWWDNEKRKFAARVPALPEYLTPRERRRAQKLMAKAERSRLAQRS